MTDREHSPPAAYPSPFDQAIARHVEQLLAERSETVLDLAHFSRISLAALYRKLHGGARWSAADVGRIAAHYGVSPGELYGEPPVEDRPAPAPLPRQPPAPARAPFSHAGSSATALL